MNVRFLSVLAASGLLAACGGGGSSSSTPTLPTGTSTLSVSLMDAPFETSSGSVSAVNITVSKVEAIDSGGNAQTVSTFSPSKQINLLDYQSSAVALGSGSIHTGQYHQIRLVLDTSSPNNNSVVVNGTEEPLSIPGMASGGFGGGSSTDSGDGASTVGIRVRMDFSAQERFSYGYVVDFNAAESIAETNAGFIMKPTLVASAESSAAFITGSVKNSSGGAVSGAQVVAEDSGGNIVNTGVTDVNGNFRINALTSGTTYKIIVNNTWTCQAGESRSATGADSTNAVELPSPVTAPASGLSITD